MCARGKYSAGAREMTGYHVTTYLSEHKPKEKVPCPPCLKGSGSGDAAVNDMPGACQSRGVTEPQREGSKADRGILHGESE